MIPVQPGPATKSSAEVRLFNRIRDELGNDWTVLHSVGLAGHATKRWAEADFVLIGPQGVYCIEVKGGRVAREGGAWQFTNRADQVNEKTEGPFAQAGGGEAALRRHLQEQHLERVGQGRIAIGWGVAFPDIRFEVAGPDIDREVVYDARDQDSSFAKYVSRLSGRWYRRLEDLWGYRPTDLRSVDVGRIVAAIRPDFDLRPGLRQLADSAARELIRLTDEQCRILDSLQEASRVVVKGSAGTGKTLLAVAECERLARLGQRTVLVCFNVRLAAWLRHLLAQVPQVEVSHFHGLARDLIAAAGRTQDLPDADDSYLNEIAIPELAFDVVVGGPSEARYDALLVDEAQDLMRDEYLAVLSALLRGGLENGCWRFFLDPKQNAFGGLLPAGLRTLERLGAFPFRLTRNCRNTEPIATMTALLAGVELEETLACEGPKVEEIEYADRPDQRRKLERVLNRLLGDRFPPNVITVLSRYRREHSCLSEPLPGVGPKIEDDWHGEQGGKGIGFATVSGFKGLENDVIVLIDVDDLATPEGLRAVYLGASRARTVLVVLRAATTTTDRLSLALDFGMRLARADAEVN